MKLSLDIPEINQLLVLLQRVEVQNNIILDKQNSEAWLTDEMVMDRFHIGKTTLFRWRQDGLPFCQETTIRRYIPSKVDEWFSKRNSTSPMEVLEEFNRKEKVSVN